ncbi:MAG: hypothetical protein M1337_02470 [Actinobacteria bacterium]|nr:hypothetical protein [Actinomycetota bacterium]
MKVKRRLARGSMVGSLLVAAVLGLLVLAGCGGGGGTSVTTAVPATTSPTTPAGSAAQTATPPGATTTTVMVESSVFSTFKSKDPFVAKIAATTPTTLTGQTTTTIVSGTTTTTAHATTTTTAHTNGGTTTTTHATTTTTHPSETGTTSHSLKILSIDVANSTAVVTFEVDGVVYQNKPVGAVVSTGWGQIKVLSINADGQTVTLLHGSETRVMSVGQQFLK